MLTDIQRAMLGDHEAAARLTEQGALIPCPWCKKLLHTLGLTMWFAIFSLADAEPAPGPEKARKKRWPPGTPAHRF